MKKAYTLTLTVLPKNLDRLLKILGQEDGLLERTVWTKVEIKII